VLKTIWLVGTLHHHTAIARTTAPFGKDAEVTACYAASICIKDKGLGKLRDVGTKGDGVPVPVRAVLFAGLRTGAERKAVQKAKPTVVVAIHIALTGAAHKARGRVILLAVDSTSVVRLFASTGHVIPRTEGIRVGSPDIPTSNRPVATSGKQKRPS